MSTNNSPEVKEELILERVFNAPRELLFKAWSEPERVMKWWGPEGFTSPSCTIDFRVGGKYVWAMRSAEGYEMWHTGVYKEIVPNERIVFSQSFSDADGNVDTNSGFDEMEVTVSFEAVEAGKTKLTLRHAGFTDKQAVGGAKAGWGSSFKKLEASLV